MPNRRPVILHPQKASSWYAGTILISCRSSCYSIFTDVVGLYLDIPDEVILHFLKEALDKWCNKTMSTVFKIGEDTSKNNYFEFNDRFRKQTDDTTTGTNFLLLMHFFHDCFRGWNFGVLS